jgi:hypothetical protein
VVTISFFSLWEQERQADSTIIAKNNLIIKLLN